MKQRTSTVLGASAVLAAGLVGLAAPATAATPSRISADQLHASIAQAVAREQANPTTVAPHPAGRASQVEVRGSLCSAD